MIRQSGSDKNFPLACEALATDCAFPSECIKRDLTKPEYSETTGMPADELLRR